MKVFVDASLLIYPEESREEEDIRGLLLGSPIEVQGVLST